TFRVRLRLGTEHLQEAELAEPEVDPVAVRLEEAAREEDRRRLLADEIRVDEAGPEADGPPANQDEEDADRTTVLIVDDNPDLRRYLRRHLLPSYRVREAADGRAALDSAREVLPDLVVADVMMPVMDGMALCDAIKTDPELDFIPVILLTARASEESKLEGLATGADDYLTKPFSTRELSARIENLIRQRRRLRERFAAGHGAPLPAGTVSGSDGPGEKDRAFLDALETTIRGKIEDEELTVDDLAREVGQSRRTLYRRVEELTGTSPMALIWKVRLEEAARLLSERAGNVGEVGYAVGFRSVSHFSRKFREHHGESPSAWRARHSPRS
ncbi:MAG: response regulator, partial [Acidobacteriota bacterium]